MLFGRLLALTLFPAGLLAPLPLAAQSSSRALIGGIETRTYDFGAPLPVRRISQIAVPMGAAMTMGSYSLDIGSYWAATTLTRRLGTFRRVVGFTDTQVRASRVIGRDQLVASLVVNLPTGRDRMSPADFDVLGTVSSAFLAFPVNAYANGGSLTAALAGVLAVRTWNIGLAASLRGNQTFTPVIDPVAGALNYRAGIEGRVRVGADRLFGEARLTTGLTISTFGDDQYAGLGTARAAYQPGVRWIGEMTLATVAAGGAVSASLWGYWRTAGDTAGVSLDNAESLVGITATGSWPVARNIDVEPGVEFRYSGVEGGRGLLGGGGVGLRTRIGPGWSAWSGVRYDRGYLDAKSFDDEGDLVVDRTSLQTWSISAFLRRSF